MYNIYIYIYMTFVRMSHLLSLEWVICWELCLELKVGTWAGQHCMKRHLWILSPKCPKDQGRSRLRNLVDLNRPPFWSFCNPLGTVDKQDPFELDANLQEASEQALFLGNEVAPHEWLHA